MAPPYSERFILGQFAAASSAVYYQVPAGRRAVVKQIFARNESSTTAAGLYFVRWLPTTVTIYGATVPALASLNLPELHAVFYAGERLGGYNTELTSWCFSGFLLKDP